jgi:hypothetical protein
VYCVALVNLKKFDYVTPLSAPVTHIGSGKNRKKVAAYLPSLQRDALTAQVAITGKLMTVLTEVVCFTHFASEQTLTSVVKQGGSGVQL